ncbi:MAG: hypothetical protein FJ026_14395, partial [Chloroflexi bacterium]|nr:hypothetical protein [Chloroflexota bacterium]
MSRIAWAKSVLERSLGVPPEDVEVASGRRLLNSLLLGVAGATVLMLAAALVAAGRGTMGVGPQVGELTLGIVVTLCSVVAVSLLRRFRATDLSGPLFLLILLVTIAMSDLPLRAGNGVRLTLLAVPLVIASVLLSPWASLVLSALSIMMLLVIGFRIQPFPNVPAVGAFL